MPARVQPGVNGRPSSLTRMTKANARPSPGRTATTAGAKNIATATAWCPGLMIRPDSPGRMRPAERMAPSG